MKTSTVIAFTLAALVSFVTAADQPNSVDLEATMTTDLDQAMPSDQAMTSDQAKSSGLRGHRSPSLFIPVGVVSDKVTATGNNVLVSNSNILLSKSDRVQLAQTIKEMMAKNPEQAGPASSMTTEDLFGLLTRLATNPAVLSNAAGVITSARSGNTGALAGHLAGLLGAALPVAPTAAPAVAPVDPELPAAVAMPIAAAPVVAPVAAPVVAPVTAPATTASVAVPMSPMPKSMPAPVAPAATTTSV